MVSPKTQKIFIIVITLLFLGFLGYGLITKEPVVVDEAISSPSNTEKTGEEILNLVKKLDAVNIDQKFFEEGLFMKLKDYSQTIFPESKGRVNPFAAVGFDAPPGSMISTAPITATTTRR